MCALGRFILLPGMGVAAVKRRFPAINSLEILRLSTPAQACGVYLEEGALTIC
jgi:hypothetical protein